MRDHSLQNCNNNNGGQGAHSSSRNCSRQLHVVREALRNIVVFVYPNGKRRTRRENSFQFSKKGNEVWRGRQASAWSPLLSLDTDCQIKKKRKNKVFTRLNELANYLLTHIFACFPLQSQLLHADDLIHLVLAVVDGDADIKTKTEPWSPSRSSIMRATIYIKEKTKEVCVSGWTLGWGI